jgi:putative glycosyltransferase
MVWPKGARVVDCALAPTGRIVVVTGQPCVQQTKAGEPGTVEAAAPVPARRASSAEAAGAGNGGPAPKLSVVTTLYHSAPYLEEFHRRLSLEARKLGQPYEIVLVDDGSPDASLDIALELMERDVTVKVIELSRNFGHHKAMMTGLDHARGELVFLIDVDLEEPPELLGEFYGIIQQGDGDVVYGYQEQRKGNAWERHSGRLAWYLMRKMYSVAIPHNHCTVRLMKREYVRALVSHRETDPVIGALWVITGFKQIGMPIRKNSRATTSYTLAHRIGTFVNGVTSFSTAPLNFMIYFGLMVSALAFTFGVYVLLQKLIYNSAVGWASLIVSIWFIGGIIMLFLGVIGMYISRIFIETKQRPYSLVRRIHDKGAG